MRKNLAIVAVVSFALVIVFSGMGFYKLAVYENPESEYSFLDESVNAYVGGDAYNYIINSTRATAYFVFGVLMSIIGFGSLFYRNTLPEDKTNKEIVSEEDISVKEVVEDGETK